MVEITEEMSTRPPIPPQAASESVQRRASIVASPPPPPSSQLEVSVSKKRKRTSWVWNHFEESVDADGNEWEKCNYCEAGSGKYRVGGKDYGTSNLNYHLTKCDKYKNTLESGSSGQHTLDFHPSNLGDEQQMVVVTFCQEACRRALIKFIVTDEQSFRMVEREGFRAFCRYLEPRFKLPSRMTVYRDICKLFVSEKANLVNYFRINRVRVCLTTDTWTSIQNYNYMVVTAHFIDDHWKLHKRIICFCLITSHEGEQIGRALEKCLIEWGLERVFTITLDNASANTKAIEYVKERVVSWGSSIVGGKHLHVRCAAHVLALVVKDGLKKYHTSVLRIRSVVKYVTSSPARMKKFLDAVSLERIEYKKGLVLDVKTRWNSIYLMLDAAEKYEKAFIRLGRSDKAFRDMFIFDIPEPVSVMGDDIDVPDDSTDVPDGSSSSDSDALEEPLAARRKAKKKKPRVHAPEKYDWSNARVLVQFLQVFYEATVEFSASTYVTSHTFLEELNDVRGELHDWKNTHDNPFLSHMGEKMLLKYNKYWGEYKKMNALLFIVVLLDPREKERGLYVIVEDLIVHDNPGQKQRLVRSWVDKVREDFDDLFAAYKSEYSVVGSVLASSESVGETGASPSQGSSSSTLTRKKKHKSHRDARKSQLSTLEDYDKSEVERYLAEPVYSPTKDKEGSKFDILAWWKINAARFDILSLIARDVLAIPISSVASESAFSTGKRILGHFRSSLRPRTVEALILLQNWLRTPIDMDPSTFRAEEDEDDAVESELFGDLSAYSIIVDDD